VHAEKVEAAGKAGSALGRPIRRPGVQGSAMREAATTAVPQMHKGAGAKHQSPPYRIAQ